MAEYDRFAWGRSLAQSPFRSERWRVVDMSVHTSWNSCGVGMQLPRCEDQAAESQNLSEQV